MEYSKYDVQRAFYENITLVVIRNIISICGRCIIMNNVYKNRIKDKLKKAIESGMLNPEQQYGMIETSIDELLIVDGISSEAVELHDNKVKKLMETLENTQKELSEHYKFFYEKILEL